MLRYLTMLSLLTIPVAALADAVTIRVAGSANTSAFSTVQVDGGVVRSLDHRRSNEGNDAVLTLDTRCVPTQIVVRSEGSTSPVVDLQGCDDVTTELRPAAVFALSGVDASWEAVAITRCDERRPERRVYSLERKPGARVEAVIEAGCIVPTLYAGEAAPEPLPRFAVNRGGSYLIESPTAREGGSLRVKIVRDDLPLEGALVEALTITSQRGEPAPTATQTTDGDGEVRLSGLAPGRVVLKVTAVRSPAVFSDVYEVQRGELIDVEIESLRPSSLTVRFKADPEWEEMLSGVTVSATPLDPNRADGDRDQRQIKAPAPQRTEAGLWRWPAILPGDWRIRAMALLHKGYATSLAETEITLFPGEDRVADLKSVVSLVSGRIRSPERSFEGASLRFEAYDRSVELSHAMVPIEPENEFRVLLLPGTYRVGFNPKVGAATWVDRKIEIGKDAVSLTIDLPAGRVSGKVRNGRGELMSECVVGARLLDAEHERDAHRRPTAHGKTTDDGAYVLDILPAGSWAVEARCDGISEPRIVTVAESTVEGVDLTVLGTSFSGIVRSASGTPLRDSRVSGKVYLPEKGEVPLQGQSNERGEITIFVPPDASGARASVMVFTGGDKSRRSIFVVNEGFEIIVPD